MRNFSFRKQELGKPSIMEDAGGIHNELPSVIQSRKQDRYDSLLGWWVSLVLILPTLAWTLGMAAEFKVREKGGEVNSVSKSGNSPPSVVHWQTKPEMQWGVNAVSAPTSPARQVPVIDRSKVNPQLLKSAIGMESMFLNHMMRVMRQTVPKNDMNLESPATEIYQGMLDSEYAEKAAHRGGIGLADQIIAYLDPQRYNQMRGQGVPKKEKP